MTSPRMRTVEGLPGVWLDDPDQKRDLKLAERLVWGLGSRFRRSAWGQRFLRQQFHLLYYEQSDQTWRSTTWRGVPIAKFTTDLWMYQEVLHRIRPDVVVETGTFSGGSALFFADLFDVMGHGRVISVDLDSETEYPQHDRITYVSGSSVDPEVVDSVRGMVDGAARVMVVLDSDHRAVHVTAELDAYHALVTPGSYLVVEDTSVNGNPTLPRFGPGPGEAASEFLRTHPEFAVDPSCERLLVSDHPGGWLRRVR